MNWAEIFKLKRRSQPKLRPSLGQVLFRLFVFIICLLSVRWFFVEPFLIPSGSMFPNLFISDYILVSKPATGLRVPWTKHWLLGPKLPQRGEIVVFKAPTGVHFVKRLIGLPGDRVSVYGHQLLQVNDQKVKTKSEPEVWKGLAPRFDPDGSMGLNLFSEQLGDQTYLTMYPPPSREEPLKIRDFHVPEGQLFFMGDNRSQSSDSREWGTVPVENLVGPVWKIFLSCEKINRQYDFCDLSTLRWDRLFSKP